jgi:hypothetical protein
MLTFIGIVQNGLRGTIAVALAVVQRFHFDARLASQKFMTNGWHGTITSTTTAINHEDRQPGTLLQKDSATWPTVCTCR